MLVVVDTNELITGTDTIDRSVLLQDYAGVDVVLPAQVVDELDGLKRSNDPAIAARARQANALLSTAVLQQEPWLLFEPKYCAAGLSADDRILRCAMQFAQHARGHPSDRVLLATSDRNLILRAAGHQVEAMPLAEAHRKAQARHHAWRAAYIKDSAVNAIAAGGWASGGTGSKDPYSL